MDTAASEPLERVDNVQVLRLSSGLKRFTVFALILNLVAFSLFGYLTAQ